MFRRPEIAAHGKAAAAATPARTLYNCAHVVCVCSMCELRCARFSHPMECMDLLGERERKIRVTPATTRKPPIVKMLFLCPCVDSERMACGVMCCLFASCKGPPTDISTVRMCVIFTYANNKPANTETDAKSATKHTYAQKKSTRTT